MDSGEWMGEWYPRIVRTLGLNSEEDARAAVLLDELTDNFKTYEEEARRLIDGRTCFVFGAGPSLRASFGRIRLEGFVSVAADGAARIFMEQGRPPPHVLVTDLDGGDDVIEWCARSGSILVVHAHGDNTNSLRRLIPTLLRLEAKLILTCQVGSFGKIKNFYGFTDGDRAAWFCHAMGARRIVLVGMDFGSRIGEYSKQASHPHPETKRVKLRLGEELIARLAREAEVYTYSGSPKLEGIPEINL
ncbi:MAG: 6-hydroxymethylpterin diphosphokinase MptE-like protein [Thermoprotei archaeon]